MIVFFFCCKGQKTVVKSLKFEGQSRKYLANLVKESVQSNPSDLRIKVPKSHDKYYSFVMSFCLSVRSFICRLVR